MSTDGRGQNGARRGHPIVLVAGLVMIWMLLWGQFTWFALVTGILLGGLVSLVFYLPAIELTGRLNPVRLVVFLVRLLVDICRASAQVAWLVLAPRYRPSNAIMAIPLRTRSDLITTLTADAISIVPGSIVLDIDRDESVLYVHVLNVHDDRELERFRQEVLDTETRLVLAVGSKEDVERVRRGEDAEHPRSEHVREEEDR